MSLVTLSGYHGGDFTHAAAAWVSTGGETEKKKQRIPALLTMLAASSHTSPFEHSQLTFKVTAEYASHVHLIKHRIGVSINGESARYKEYTHDRFYIPEDWPDVAKNELAKECTKSFQRYHSAIKQFEESGMDRKRAKESARFFLPLAAQIDLMITMNFNSFVHFQKLRNSEHAQLEIRHIAQKMLELVKTETGGAFEHSLAAHGL